MERARESRVSWPRFRGTPTTIAVAKDWSRRVQLGFDGARGPALPSTFGSRADPSASAFAPRTTALSWVAARSWQGSLLAGLMLAALGLAWLSWPRPLPVALPLALPMPAPEPPAPPAPVRFADGSQAQLHGERSALFTEEESSESVRLRLAGGARFDVVPSKTRSFVVANNQVVVRVLGTAFSLDPDGTRTRVAVERGRVQVIWRSGAAIMSAGEVGVFPPENEPAFVPASLYDSPARAEGPKKKGKGRKRHHKRAR
jgi:ferric-dicitrate binding protein FerR (iron transport regulator)